MERIRQRLRVFRGVEPYEPPEEVPLGFLVERCSVLRAQPRFDWAGVPVALIDARVSLVVEKGERVKLLTREKMEFGEIPWEVGVLFAFVAGHEGL